MKKDDASYRVRIHPTEHGSLPLGHVDDQHEQDHINADQQRGSPKAKAFANSCKNEIGMLFWHKVALGLGAFQKSFAPKTSGTNCYFRLFYVVIIRFLGLLFLF